MVRAIRITDQSYDAWMSIAPIFMTDHVAKAGDIIVYRPNDIVIMNAAAFDYQYEFIGAEEPLTATEVRVKDTPEARAELLRITEEREALMLVISKVLDDDYALDNVPNEIGEALADKLIEEGWHKECE